MSLNIKIINLDQLKIMMNLINKLELCLVSIDKIKNMNFYQVHN